MKLTSSRPIGYLCWKLLLFVAACLLGVGGKWKERGEPLPSFQSTQGLAGLNPNFNTTFSGSFREFWGNLVAILWKSCVWRSPFPRSVCLVITWLKKKKGKKTKNSPQGHTGCSWWIGKSNSIAHHMYKLCNADSWMPRMLFFNPRLNMNECSQTQYR